MSQPQRAKRRPSVKPRASADPEDTIQKNLLTLENDRLGESLAAVSALNDNVAAENRQLQQDAVKREQENFEVADYLRRDLAERKHEIQELVKRKHEAEQHAATQLQELHAQLVRERQEAAARATDTEDALRAHVQELEARLASVAGFREQQGSIAREMRYLRSERDRAKRELDDQAQAHEAALQQQREHLRREAEQAAAAAAVAHDQSLDTQLDARSARLLQDNHRLHAELKLHAEESTRMCSELKGLRDSQQELQRQVAIAQQLEAQYSQRGVAQKRELAAARREISALTEKVKAADAAFQAQLRAADSAAAADKAVAEAETDTLRRMLDIKGRELKQLKTLSHAVLQQRSDVEAFLLSSLELVQAEGAKWALLQPAPGTMDGASSPVNQKPLPAPHFDIQRLSWEDREKVLRLLFARLNDDPEQHKFFKHLPPHIK